MGRIEQRNCAGKRRVTSLDEFRLLYENDLGLPDFLSDSNQWKITNGYNISDPVNAAEVLLGIFPAVSQVEGSNQDAAPYNDIRKVTFTFKDNSKVVVTMVNQFGQGWLPQDWTDAAAFVPARRRISRSSTHAACCTRAHSISSRF